MINGARRECTNLGEATTNGKKRDGGEEYKSKVGVKQTRRENERRFEVSGPPRVFPGAERDALATVGISLREVGQETHGGRETARYERVATLRAL